MNGRCVLTRLPPTTFEIALAKMGKTCAVFGCNTGTKKDKRERKANPDSVPVSVFRFPTDEAETKVSKRRKNHRIFHALKYYYIFAINIFILYERYEINT